MEVGAVGMLLGLLIGIAENLIEVVEAIGVNVTVKYLALVRSMHHAGRTGQD